MKTADIIVACVDAFRTREAINKFCRRYLIPLVDVGMTIETRGERLAFADGQVIVSMPGHPCMRCWFLTDAVLKREQEERPAGYDRNPDAPGDPQVVSMNGTRLRGMQLRPRPHHRLQQRPARPALVLQGLGDPVR